MPCGSTALVRCVLAPEEVYVFKAEVCPQCETGAYRLLIALSGLSYHFPSGNGVIASTPQSLATIHFTVVSFEANHHS